MMKYEKRFSTISLIYLLTTGGILAVVVVCSASGLGILKDFIIALVENFDIHITMQNLISVFEGQQYELTFFCFSMVQVTYISRIIGRFIEDGTYIDEIFMLLGSTCLSCFLGISYGLYPIGLLESRIGRGAVWILIGADVIYSFIKGVQGIFNSKWGGYTFGIRFIFYIFLNPIALGILCVYLPTVFEVQLYAWLYNTVLYKNIILLVVAVVLISYPMNRLCGKLIDILLDIVNIPYVGTVDIFYGIFSVAMIIGWFVLMFFKPEYTDITFCINNENYTYKPIKTVNRGIVGEKIWWGYFSDGTLIIDGQYGRMDDYSFDDSPWYGYRDKIDRIVILDGTEYVGACAFCNISNVKEIYISKDVEEISNMVFLNCKSLEAINVAEENPVYSSVDGVLYNKQKTKLLECPDGKITINIPETVIKIVEDFSYNRVLKEINVSGDNRAFSSKGGVLYDKIGTTLIRCPIGKEGKYTIYNGTEQIESYAFQYCKKLENVILSDKLEEIGWDAFAGCKKLKNIVIPENVKKIGSYVFMDCEELQKVVFEGKLEEIGYDVFLNSDPQIFNLNLPLEEYKPHVHGGGAQ